MTRQLWLPTVAAILTLCAFSSQASADYPTSVLADNPIGYWRLGEGSGPLASDSSGFGRDLDYTLFSAGNYAQPGAILGDSDTAIGLVPVGADAASGTPSTHPTIVSPNSTDFGFASGQSFSLEYWIKAAPGNASTNSTGLLVKGYDETQATPWYLSRYQSSGAVDFFLRAGGGAGDRVVTSTSSVNNDQWRYVVGVYDAAAAEIQIYVDSVLEGTVGGVPADAYGTNSRPFSVGNHLNRGVDVSLDEIAIYDQALSPTQIFDRFLAGGGQLPPADPWVNIDFSSSAGSGGGPSGVQGGFIGMAGTENGGTGDVTKSVASSLGIGNNVNVTIGGYTHFRNYAGLTGNTAALSPLLSDMVLRNAGGTMTLTIEDLKPGTYEITTYQHSPPSGGGSLDINLNDANGTGQSIASGVAISAGTVPSDISLVTFNIISDGSPVSIDFVGGTASQHNSLNGFRLTAADLRPKIPVLAVDINDRAATGGGNTQLGFREFSINGAGSAPTTVNYPDLGLTVTLGSSNGEESDDRRRGEPTNGGLFTEQELLRDFVFSRGATPDDGVDVLVEGLKSDQLYEVTIWSVDDLSSNPARVSDWFANGELVKDNYSFDGAGVPPAPAFNDTYSFTFEASSNGSGELLIGGRQAGESIGVFLNAFEIVEVVPEPSSLALISLGLALLAPVTRRRRR